MPAAITGRCPECGAAPQPSTCDELFAVLLALDHSRAEPWGPRHGAAVAAFLLQHPSRHPDGLGARLELLRTYLRDDVAGLTDYARRQRRANSHRTSGPLPQPEIPLPAAAPTTFAVTIADVARDGTFPAESYSDSLRAWAAATDAAWST